MTCSRRKIIQFESIPLKYLSWLLKRLNNMHDLDMLVFYFLERALNQATIRCWMLCFLEHLWKSHQIFKSVISGKTPLIKKSKKSQRLEPVWSTPSYRRQSFQHFSFPHPKYLWIPPSGPPMGVSVFKSGNQAWTRIVGLVLNKYTTSDS